VFLSPREQCLTFRQSIDQTWANTSTVVRTRVYCHAMCSILFGTALSKCSHYGWRKYLPHGHACTVNVHKTNSHLSSWFVCLVLTWLRCLVCCVWCSTWLLFCTIRLIWVHVLTGAIIRKYINVFLITVGRDLLYRRPWCLFSDNGALCGHKRQASRL
jgi:hypothetical protein